MWSKLPNVTREYYLNGLGSIQNLTVRDAPVPPLKSGEVLVNIIATSLNYRDLIIASGQYAIGKTTENPVPLSDGAGKIIAVGEDVKGWAVGDRVCANFSLDHIYGDATPETDASSLGGQVHGVLTQFRSFPAHSLVRIPNHLSYEEAATLPCAAVTAYNALHGPKPIKAGDIVLVQGTGGVSIFGLQFAVASGATVIATSSSDEKLKITKTLGAKHLINYNTTPNWEEEVKKITNDRGVDHVIEVAATLDKSIEAVRMEGSIHVIGFVAKDRNAQDLTMNILRKGVHVRGIRIGSVSQFNDMNRMIEANDIRPVVDKVFEFEEALQAYEYLQSQKHVGKVVVHTARDYVDKGTPV